MTTEKRPRSESRLRTKLVGVRVTPEEYKALLAEAKAQGISASEFLRRASAAEIEILQQQRVVRDAAIQARRLPRGVTLGSAQTLTIEVP